MVKQKHGLSLKEAQAIFDQVYLVDQKNDDPEQFRAIGWCGGRLCSVIFEIRRMRKESIIASLLRGRRLLRKNKAMPKTSKKSPSADEIAEMATRGEDISGYFTSRFKVVRPIQRVNVDLTQGMLRL